MKTVQIIKTDIDEVIASFTEYEDGVKGICANGYNVLVDGEELKNSANEQS